MGHEKRREENNKEVMMKHDQNQKKKTRHCLMDMEYKGCVVQSDSDGISLGQWAALIVGCVDDKLC